MNTVLSAYNWAAVIVALLFLLLIARFYEVKSGERSHFLWFLIPVVFFLVAGIQSIALHGSTLGDPVFEAFVFAAGGVAFVLGRALLRLMTGGR
jgi:hypothetical protein